MPVRWAADETAAAFKKGWVSMGTFKVTRPDGQVTTVKVTLGSDPEFNFFLNGNFVAAHRYLHDSDREKVVGLDGNPETGELRPPAGKDHVEHFNEIRRALENLATVANQKGLDVDVVGNLRALGFHVHVGVKTLRDGREETPFLITMLRHRLVAALDKHLGKAFLSFSGAARNRHYRHLGACETKAWGFEYRSLPALLLQEPDMCQLVLKTAECVVTDVLRIYLEHPEEEATSRYEAFMAEDTFKQRCRWLGRQTFLKTWNGFRQRYNTPEKRRAAQATLLQAWDLKKSVPVKQPPAQETLEVHPGQLHVAFSSQDTFVPEAKQLIRNILGVLNLPITLYVYGLHQGRGDRALATSWTILSRHQAELLPHGIDDFLISPPNMLEVARIRLSNLGRDVYALGLPRAIRVSTAANSLLRLNLICSILRESLATHLAATDPVDQDRVEVEVSRPRGSMTLRRGETVFFNNNDVLPSEVPPVNCRCDQVIGVARTDGTDHPTPLNQATPNEEEPS